MINKFLLFARLNPDKYFNLPVIICLSLIIPSTVILLSIFFSVFNFNFLMFDLHDVIKYTDPYPVISICPFVSVVICFADIVYINIANTGDKLPAGFTENKSYMNTAIITVNLLYVLFIHFYTALDGLGNIPVGRN